MPQITCLLCGRVLWDRLFNSQSQIHRAEACNSALLFKGRSTLPFAVRTLPRKKLENRHKSSVTDATQGLADRESKTHPYCPDIASHQPALHVKS